MSTEIDKRIVEMQFNNKDFEKNVQQSLSTIDKLKLALDFDGGKGFDSITKAANKMDLSNVDKQLEQVQARFSAIQIAGYTFVSELTKSFMSFGKNIINSTFGQIKSGGMARALKIEQAEFKMKALAKNMFDASMDADVLEGKINGLMDKMGTAIDNAVTGTAYGYDAAADVASQLMASGVRDAQKMENYLKGVAGAAAMTGNSFEQLGHVFTTVASNGKLMTMQLRQFSTYGLNLSATLAQQMHKSEAEINSLVADGKITFEEFANALSVAYGDAAQEADNTFEGVTTNIKAQLSRLGQRFAKPFIENLIPMLKEVKQAIKNISAAIAPVAERFNKSFGYLTNWLKELIEGKDFKMVETFFRGLENIIYGVVIVFRTLHKAVERVFPKPFTKTLYEISKGFLQFSQDILPTKEALEGLENIFVALLTPFKLFGKLLGNLAKILNPVAAFIANITNGILSLFTFASPLLDMLINFVKNTDLIGKAALVISNTIAVMLILLRGLITILAMVVFQISQITSLDEVIGFLKTLGSIVLTVGKYLLMALGAPLALVFAAISKIGEYLPGLIDTITKGATSIYNTVVPLIDTVKEALETKDITKIKSAIEDSLDDISRKLKRFAKKHNLDDKFEALKYNLTKVIDIIKTLGDTIKSRLSQLTAAQVIFTSFGVSAIVLVLSLIRLNDAFTRFVLTVRQIPFLFTRISQTLKSFNKYIAPSMLIMSFAVAIGVLAVSLDKISKIPAADLDRASKVIITFMSALMLFTFIMMKTSTITTDATKIVTVLQPSGGVILAIAVSMLVLAKALIVMNEAIKACDNMVETFGYLLLLMVSLAGILVGMAKLAPVLNISAFAFTAFAGSIYILSRALIVLSNSKKDISPESLSTILSLMLGLAVAIRLTAKATLGGAVSILAFSVSLLMIGAALTMFMSIPWDTAENALKRARLVFELFLPLIIAIGIANKLSASVNAINISTGLGGLVLAMSVFLLSFAAFTKIMETVNPYTLEISIKALIALMVGMVIMVGIMIAIHTKSEILQRKTLDATKGVQLISRSVADMGILVIAMSAGLLIMALAARALTDVPWYNIVAAILIFIVIAGVMEDLVSEMKSFKDISVKPILGLIGTLIAVMGSLALLTFAAKDDPKAVLVAAGAVTAALIGMAALMAAMKGFAKQSRQINTNVASATDEILALMALLGLVAFMMVYVTDKIGYAEDIMAFDATMGLLMVGMIGISLSAAAIMKILNSIRVDQMITLGESKLWALAGMFALIITSMMSIAGAMLLLSKIPVNDLKYVGITMGIIAVAVLAIMAITPLILKLWEGVNPKSFMEVGAGIAIFSSSLVLIASALAIISQLTNPESLVKDAVVIGALLLEVGLIMVALVALDRNFDGATVSNAGLGLLAAAAGILAIASAFALLEAVHADPEHILTYAIAIGAVLAVLLLGATVLVAVANHSLAAIPVLQSLALAFGALGTVLIGGGVLLEGLAESFKVFSHATEEEVNIVINNFLVLVNRIPEIITAIALAIMQSGPAVGLAIASIFTFMITAIAVSLAQSINAILEALSTVVRAIVDWLMEPSTVQLIHDATYALSQAFIEGFVDGLFDYINDNPKVQEFFEKFYGMFDLGKPIQEYDYDKFVYEQATRLQDAMRSIYRGDATWEEYGGYIIEGLNNGIRKGYWTTAQAMEQLAEYGLEAYADELEIHSPSLKMIKMGRFTVMGVIEGIQSGEYTLQEVMAALAEAGVDSFSSIFTDSNLLKNFHLGSKILTREDLLLSGGAWHYDQQLGDYVQTWQEAGYDSLEDYVEKHLEDQSAGFNLLEDLLGGFKTDDVFKDFDMSGMTESLDDVGDEADKAAERLEKLIEKVLDCLDVFTEFNKKTEMTAKDVMKTFIGQFEGVGEWADMLIDLANRGLSAGLLSQLEEEGPKSYEKVHALYTMSNKEIAMLNAMYLDTADLAKKSIDYIDKAINESVKDDRRLVLDSLLDEEDLNLSGIQKEVEETSYSFEKFDDDIKSVLEQLYELQKEGNVNLLMRPTIDTSELNNAGYDAGDGFATMFTSTFSNETEDIAMNFTPIMVDPKTGKYLGVMSPDEFESYCQDVVDGVKKDDLNLKVGMTFNGKDAIKKATQTAEQIHELHEQLGEDWGEDKWSQIDITSTIIPVTDSASEYVEKETSSILDTLENFGREAIQTLRTQLKFEEAFEEAIKGVKDFRDEFANTLSDSLNLFDEVTEQEEISTTEILNNMEENLKRIGGWSYNLRKMIKMGFSEGLVEELRQMGPEAANKVEAFVRMGANEIDMANRYFAESVKLPTRISDRVVSDYANAGFNASLGFAEGIDPEVTEEVIYQLANNSLSYLEEALDIHSPSLKMMQDGIYAVQGFILGLKDEASMAELDEATQYISNKVKEGLSMNKFADKLLKIGSIEIDDVYEPVIRPVWDTTAIETGFTTIDQFLSGKTISLKAVDAAAQRSGPSQDAVMITNAINNLYNEQKIIRNDINNIRSDVSTLGNRIDGMYVRLDGNALVGQLVAPLDKAMGKKVVTQKRGRV